MAQAAAVVRDARLRLLGVPQVGLRNEDVAWEMADQILSQPPDAQFNSEPVGFKTNDRFQTV
eukprot:6710013-Alexandrium_andersonii.AAC.1